MKTPILGSAYVARSNNAADNRMVNLFPEIIPEGGKEPAFLSRAPGLRLVRSVGNGPVRGMYPFGDYLYVVSGSELYKVDATESDTPGTWTEAPDNAGIAAASSITGSGTISLAVTVGGGAPTVSTLAAYAPYNVTYSNQRPVRVVQSNDGVRYVSDLLGNKIRGYDASGTLVKTIDFGTLSKTFTGGIEYVGSTNELLVGIYPGVSNTQCRIARYNLNTDTLTDLFITGSHAMESLILCDDGTLFAGWNDFSDTPYVYKYLNALALSTDTPQFSGSYLYSTWTVDRTDSSALYYFDNSANRFRRYSGSVNFSRGTGDYLGADGNWYPQGNAAAAFNLGAIDGNNTGMAFDSSGNLYITDRDHSVIYKVAPGVAPIVWAGANNIATITNGSLDTARFGDPGALSYSNIAGTLFVHDRPGTVGTNTTVREIDNVPGGTTPQYQYTVGAETWPASPSDWATIAAGSPHAFTLATLTFDAAAPTSTAGTYTNSLTGPVSHSTLLGTIAGVGPVSMVAGVFHPPLGAITEKLFIAANGPGYLYDITNDSFAQITDALFLGSRTVNYLDGYFIFAVPDKPFAQFSDGSTFDASNLISLDTDNVVGTIVDHREIWVFGNNTVEVYYPDGTPDQVFSRIGGAVNEVGCAAPYSIAKLDNSVFWLGNDARGRGIVYRSNGYSGERISTHGVEWVIQGYGDLSNAIGYTYQQDGHSFYVLVFPDADTTWVYDVATGAWHERAGFDNGAFTRHRGNCHAFYGGEHLVGDYANGNLYALDLDTFSDDGAVQKWLRTWRALPQGANNLKRTAHHSLQLDCEVGVGVVSGQGSDPRVMLRWSDDGCRTWSNEHRVTMGAIGRYGQRVIWRRLGMTNKLRDRVYEVSGTDPVKIAILGAELIVSATNA